MPRWPIMVTVPAISWLFWWGVPLLRLYDAFQPMITALTIMVAAVLVRLNRGMPSLEWKSVEPSLRSKLTSRILALAEEYARILIIEAIGLLGLVSLMVIGRADISLWPLIAQKITSGFLGGLATLCILRMAYVVWRDTDIVRLQKEVIDGAAGQDVAQSDQNQASEKIANIRSAGIRAIDVPPPKAWNE